ncbi:unnamed protein product [Malus baccata var. baccata]|uniref:Transmembrane protein n=2 Tax=Maleae TaxID=721813 RepID=A0A5N5HW57_9ROSA|nr:hypothetical protein D8674_042548 [Pyrus ussuriensis x Pyrus communis]TQD81758.1 hypothetical protein C1H46_032692 [Malus baccata]
MAREIISRHRFVVALLVVSFILLSAAVEARPLDVHGSPVHHQIHHHSHSHPVHHNPRKAAGQSGGGVGNYFADVLSLWGIKNSGPSPGEGH